MKCRCWVFFLLFAATLLVFPQYKPWYNQYNFVYGTKAMSMGNAFTAVADDLTAVFWNPAGLAAMRSPMFHFAYQAENQTHSYEAQEKFVPGADMQYNFQLNYKLEQINFFSVSVPAEFLKMKWGFALSYFRYIPYGFKGAAEEALSFSPNDWATETATVNFKGSEGFDVLAISAAAAISEYFALGCTIQQFFGSGSMHLQNLNQDAEVHEQYTESLRGRIFIVGIMFSPFKALNLGLTYHSASKNNFDSSLLVWEVDELGTEVNRKAFNTLALVGIPAQYSLGAALRPAQWLNLSFDYSRIYWQKATLENYYIPGSVIPYPQKDDFDSEQKNVSNLRLGMEINVPLRWFLLHLRGGWSTDKQLYADSTGQPVKVHAYAAGVAFEFSRSLLLEVAYQRKTAAWSENGYFVKEQAVASHYKANLLKFSLTYRFGGIFKE
ncbi:MAG: outer membrane protein transport protein [Candidatus Aminicenantes bacterium]|nr:outer membrane protein transport protein [Candidatus Aminicenantes bacterium]